MEENPFNEIKSSTRKESAAMYDTVSPQPLLELSPAQVTTHLTGALALLPQQGALPSERAGAASTTPRCRKSPCRLATSKLLTRVSTGSQSHNAQERVIREMLIELLDLQLDEERCVIHSTYTGLEYRYHEALDEILRMAERQEFDVLCLDVLDRGLGRKGVSREIFRGQLRGLGIHILTTEPSDHSDDDSLEGQLMRLLKGYKAEEEVNDFVRRSKNAIRHKALGDPEKNIPLK
jgi:hypothetical protein